MIVIIGGTGMVGSGIVRYMIEKSIDYVSFNSKTIDSNDYKILSNKIKQLKPELIINCIGGMTSRACATDKEGAHKLFLYPSINIINVCRELDIPLLHISSSSVFDGKEGFYTEYDIPNPITLYGRLKYIEELLILVSLEKYYIVRLPMTYGKHTSSRSDIIEKLLDIYNNSEQKLSLTIDRLETPSFNKDIGMGIIDVYLENYPYGVYHVSNSGYTNYLNFFKEICRIKDIKFDRSKINLINETGMQSCSPLKSIIISEKLPEKRNWLKALEEYLNEN